MAARPCSPHSGGRRWRKIRSFRSSSRVARRARKSPSPGSTIAATSAPTRQRSPSPFSSPHMQREDRSLQAIEAGSFHRRAMPPSNSLRTHMPDFPRRGSWIVALLSVVAIPVVLAQGSAVDEIAKYRAALQDGNPAELWTARGEDLWKQKRGPKQVSLEQCDLGLGAG